MVRTSESMLKEWRFHNWACNLKYKVDRMADCDFNNADEGMGLWDYVGR